MPLFKKLSFGILICLPFMLFAQQTDGIFAKIKTNKGDIAIALEYKKAPITVANFIGLAEGKIPNEHKEKGVPYYNALTFHRVVPDGIIQGGCPLGNGEGNPGYRFKDEFHTELKHNEAGIVSMANSGKNTNGSQFFITHRAIPSLDGKHSVFGKVIEGLDVVNKIVEGDNIISVTITRKGKEAEEFDIHSIFPEKMRK